MCQYCKPQLYTQDWFCYLPLAHSCKDVCGRRVHRNNNARAPHPHLAASFILAVALVHDCSGTVPACGVRICTAAACFCERLRHEVVESKLESVGKIPLSLKACEMHRMGLIGIHTALANAARPDLVRAVKHVPMPPWQLRTTRR